MRALIAAIEQGLREEACGRAVVPPRLNMLAVLNDSGLMRYFTAWCAKWCAICTTAWFYGFTLT